jgi:hypothetical protein
LIVGDCAPGESPRLIGYIHFPLPVDMTIKVPFLVDTGAQWTTISAVDLLQLGDKLPQLGTVQAPVAVRAASGGTFRQGMAHCGLILVHEDQRTSLFALNAGIALSAAASAGVPSLLGMDVVSHGALLVLAENRRVEFDPPTGDIIEIMPPWSRSRT